MALTPTIVENVAFARSTSVSHEVRPIQLASADTQVNAELPLTKRCHRAALLGENKEVLSAKPRIAAVLMSSIGANLH